jgi:hypothetical protein
MTLNSGSPFDLITTSDITPRAYQRHDQAVNGAGEAFFGYVRVSRRLQVIPKIGYSCENRSDDYRQTWTGNGAGAVESTAIITPQNSELGVGRMLMPLCSC